MATGNNLIVNPDNPLETVENFLIDKLFENSAEILKYYEENRDEITNDFLLYFTQLCEKGTQQQKTNIKAPISYIHIGFLRSSFLTESYEFRLGLHNNKLWLDTTDTSVYWKADFIFKHVEPDMDEVQQMLKPFQMLEYEIHEIKYNYTQCYLIPVAFQIVQDIMFEAVETSEILQLKFDEQMSVMFGGYMERGEKI